MSFVRVGGLQLHYTQSGAGEDLVLLHGLGGSTRDWAENVPALERHFRVTCIDARGHGDSDKPMGPYSMEMMAMDVIRFLDALEMDRVHLLGLSMGGMIAQHVALLAPERLHSLILVNTCAAFEAKGISSRIRKYIRMVVMLTFSMEDIGKFIAKTLFPKPDQAHWREYIERQWAANDRHCYLSAAFAIKSHNTKARLCEIQTPTLVVTGDYDRTIPLYSKHELFEKIPHAQILVVPVSGHATPIDQKDIFNAKVREFLEGVAAAKKNSRPVPSVDPPILA